MSVHDSDVCSHRPEQSLVQDNSNQLIKANTGYSEDLILTIARVILEQRMIGGDVMDDPASVSAFFRAHFSQFEREVFGCLFLDTRHRVIVYEDMFFGTIDGATVHPREVVKRALELNAAALICAHNHPSGNPEPSAADLTITQRLAEALSLVDVRLLDHFVIAGAHSVSLAQRGYV